MDSKNLFSTTQLKFTWVCQTIKASNRALDKRKSDCCLSMLLNKYFRLEIWGNPHTDQKRDDTVLMSKLNQTK